MTNTRKWEIAALLVKHYLENTHGIDTYNVTRKKLLVILERYPCSNSIATAMEFAVTGRIDMCQNNELYLWLMYAIPKERRMEISIILLPYIKTLADELNISEVQLIEFYRVLLIDIINRELAQTEDEAPLYIKTNNHELA